MRPISLPILICLILISVSSFSQAQGIISITQKDSGRSIDVEVVSVAKGLLNFETKGKPFQIPISKLTQDSIDRLKAHLATKGAPTAEQASAAKKLNEIVGHELFGTEALLWKETGEDVAGRLDWVLESKNKDSSSYRLYTQSKYQFLGAHPYCVTLYGGAEDITERLSLVYANKGDFGSRFGVGENHFRVMHPDKEPPGDLDEAIKFDAAQITQSLTTALGEPKQQYFGEREDKRKVDRWDMGEHAFLLSELKSEYVSLLIVPTSVADAKGKVERINDRELKHSHLTNIARKDNGDVVIENIPMVNQGPKGYCAPATFERAMRYMRIPADMYLLATAATDPAGGTNTTKLKEDCERIVFSKARRVRELEFDGDLEMKKLQKYIDKGVPILWRMRSLTNYNKIANKRTKQRESVTDYTEWAADIAAEAQTTSGLKVQDSHHICLIIGYNESTREVAVSDSWGPRYELRWVHIDIASAVTSSGGFVFDF